MPAQVMCQLWGVLNVTPDSFSDGGRFLAAENAVVHAFEMLAAGADVIDVGGASSRPPGHVYGLGAEPVTAHAERERVETVVRALSARSVLVSIDTVNAAVAEVALEAGARIVNDVSCAGREALLRVTADAGADYVLMHNRGDGAVSGDNIAYGDCVAEVLDELRRGLDRAVGAGIAPERIWLDPGLGFAKTAAQSLALLAATARLVETGQRVLVGPSRKAFIAACAPQPDGTQPEPSQRQPGTDAAVTVAVLGGASAVRVHDVPASYQAVRVALGVRGAAGGSAP